MLQQLLGIALLAAALAGCGEASLAGPPTVAPTTSPSPLTAAPAGNSEGGFGSPAQADGEFAIEGTPHPVRGELQLADNGCWYVSIGGSSHLIVFPVGFEIPFSDDPTIIAAPDGTTFASGASVDGTAHRVGVDRVPGGDAGRWGNYISFCDPEEQSLAVFETIETAFDPEILGTGAIEAMATDAVFTQSWPCGRGWAISTEDQLVGLFIYQQEETELAPGAAITLPNEAWAADLIVGKYLFVNHCDDVIEDWEPAAVIAGRWELTTGTLELLDGLPADAGSAPVRAILSGASFTTETGTVIWLDSIDLENTAFNVFAG